MAFNTTMEKSDPQYMYRDTAEMDALAVTVLEMIEGAAAQDFDLGPVEVSAGHPWLFQVYSAESSTVFYSGTSGKQTIEVMDEAENGKLTRLIAIYPSENEEIGPLRIHLNPDKKPLVLVSADKNPDIEKYTTYYPRPDGALSDQVIAAVGRIAGAVGEKIPEPAAPAANPLPAAHFDM